MIVLQTASEFKPYEACESLHRLAANAEHCQKYGNLRVGEQVHIEALLILPKLRRSHQLLELIAGLDQESARHGPQGQARDMISNIRFKKPLRSLSY